MATTSLIPILDIEKEIYRLLAEERPRIGVEMDAFIERQSEYYALPETQIRRMVAKANHARQAEVRGMMSDIQQACAIMQLDDGLLVEKVLELMNATKQVPCFDKEGKPIMVDGQPFVLETPNWAARSRGVELAAKMKGSFAPKQVHIEAHHEYSTDVSEAEIERKLTRIANGLGYKLEPGAGAIDAEFSVEQAPAAGGVAPAGPATGGKRRGLLPEQPDRDD